MEKFVYCPNHESMVHDQPPWVDFGEPERCQLKKEGPLE